MSKVNNAVQEGLAATDRIFDIIESENDIRESDTPPRPLQDGPHRVTFENVGFKYDRRMVLEQINLDVRSGEILAIVGTSGGGKTSLVNLIPRFYDVSQGRVRIDGLDIRQVGLSAPAAPDCHRHPGPDPVQQHHWRQYRLWQSRRQSVPDPGAAGQPMPMILSAASAASTTPHRRTGGALSGGEKQRICIAGPC